VDATAVTDGAGNYTFAGLGPGTYRVRHVVPAGRVQTTANPADIVATSGANVSGVSFGSTFTPVTLSGVVFRDLNGNGTRDPGEPGIPGVTVERQTTGGAVVASTVTGAGGSYALTGAGPGTHRVRQVVPAGLLQVTPNPSDVVVAVSGVSVSGLDFGDGAALVLTGTGPGGAAHVRSFDPTGAPGLASFFAYDPGFVGGAFVAAGDLRGDGLTRIVTGTGVSGGSHVRAFALDGTPQPTSFLAYDPGFLGGVRVAVCDVDGDGADDLVLTPGPGGGPHIRVARLDAAGAPAADLASFLAYDPGFLGGLWVACGDVDGDGVPDVITGTDVGGGPHVRAVSLAGGTPTEIAGFFALPPGFTGGVRVAAGNVDASDRDSIVEGAGPGGGPQVRVLKLAGGTVQELASFFAYPGGFTGGVFVAAGRLLSDGRAQVVTGPGAGGAPQVRVFSGTGADTGIAFFAYDVGLLGGVTVGATP
jgi:hypothetical protein